MRARAAYPPSPPHMHTPPTHNAHHTPLTPSPAVEGRPVDFEWEGGTGALRFELEGGEAPSAPKDCALQFCPAQEEE